MFRRLFNVKASLFVFVIAAFAMAAIACSSQPAAAPAPAPAPAQPAIDPAELSKLVQDAVKQSVPEQQGGPAPVSAAEIQSMVEAAVSAGAPEGASAEEISAMVQQAVAAAAQPAAQPGASKADIEDIVAKAVGESAQSQSGVSASEVQKIVSDAIKGIPAAAPAPAAPAAPSPGAEMVRDVWGQSVEKPRYGGSIPIATNVAPEIFDPWFGDWISVYGEYIWDDLCVMDWSIPRSERDFTAGYKDMGFYTGHLATSWDISPDLLKYTFNLRDDVLWHDKAPLDGRVFTADDVKYSWDRVLGLEQFAEAGPSPHDWLLNTLSVTSIESVDAQTVVVNAEVGSLENIGRLCGIGGPWTNTFVPPEVIEQHGDMKNWETVVGTGPYEITDFVPLSLIELTKNPSYFQTDPVFPDLENQLPYADEIKIHVIPDAAARVAALRTGKTVMQGGQHLNLDQVNSLRKTNPELAVVKITGTSKSDPAFYIGDAPFNDRNVRWAMQKAINVPEIIESYYNGDADPTPWGFAPSPAIGYYTPFEQLPDDVKQLFEYDPAEAERLLDAAGYPRDGDGIRFETNWDVFPPWGHDIDLSLIVASYWEKVGVKVTITQVAEDSEMSERRTNAEYGGMTSCGCRHKNFNPMVSNVGRFGVPQTWLNTGINDPVYQAIIDEAQSTSDQAELLRLATQMDDYFVKEMWTVWLPVTPQYMLVQPWLKGYRGEDGGGDEGWMTHLKYTWIDLKLQNDLGHD